MQAALLRSSLSFGAMETWTVSTEARGLSYLHIVYMQAALLRSSLSFGATEGEGGAGGSRTLVQIRYRDTVYMLCSQLIFDREPDVNALL